MIKFIFTEKVRKKFQKLEVSDQKRIFEKLSFLKEHPDIFSIVKHLEDLPPSTHRLRIGNFRLLLKVLENTKEQTTFRILKIGHRRDVYL